MGCHFIYNNGGRARFSRQHASTRSLATCGRAQNVPASTSFHVTMDSFSACSGGLMVVSTCHQLSERAPGVAQPLRSRWRSARARKKDEGRGFRSKQSVAQGQPLQILVSERARCNFCHSFLWKLPICGCLPQSMVDSHAKCRHAAPHRSLPHFVRVRRLFRMPRLSLWAYLTRSGLFCRPFVLVPFEKLQVCSVVFRERLCVV